MATFDVNRLFALLKQGKTQKECAQILGVSEGTVSKHIKKTKTAINKDIALFSADRYLPDAVDSCDSHYLDDLYIAKKKNNYFLDVALSYYNSTPGTPEHMEAKKKFQAYAGTGKNAKTVHNVFLDLQEQNRKTAQLINEIEKTTHDLEKIKKVQQVILETIQKTDMETAKKIVAELARLKIIRSTLDFDITHSSQALESGQDVNDL